VVEIQELDAKTWSDALGSGPAFLILGKTTCQACTEWAEELSGWEHTHPDVNVVKIMLDRPGLARFKMAHPWVAEVDMLPMNVLMRDGEVLKQWAGAGLPRLEARLKRVMG
jgi:hypothetical protein